MQATYCGNNALDRRLVDGSLVLGTRHGCMTKGIGKGRSMPVDNNYGGAYEPIDQRKIYCGANVNLPDGYDRMGNISQCLQKGIGIGKKITYDRHAAHPTIFTPVILSGLTWVAIFGITMGLLYITKPDLVLTNETLSKDKKVDVWKTITLSFVISSILLITIKYIKNRR